MGNVKYTLNALVISLLSLFGIFLFVEFILSKFSIILFTTRVFIMLGTFFIIGILILFLIIYIYKFFRKKELYDFKNIILLAVVTFSMIGTTSILIREEGKYIHTINLNWGIELPRKYDEIYYKDSGGSFLGDGYRYTVFQYDYLEDINNLLGWEKKGKEEVEELSKIVISNLYIENKYKPNLEGDLKYYYKIKDDNSKLYLILNGESKVLYILEHFM